MTQLAVKQTREAFQPTEGWEGIVADWSSDQRAFKNVPWGKAMMWIFLLSDTFVFSCFLLSYMTVRMSTTVPWPNSSRSEEHTSELQSLMRSSYAVFCLKQKTTYIINNKKKEA